jgi:transposase
VLRLSVHQRYFLFRGNADMRKSFDGLSGIVRDGLNKDPLGGDVFVFVNQRRNQIKLLYQDLTCDTSRHKTSGYSAAKKSCPYEVNVDSVLGITKAL